MLFLLKIIKFNKVMCLNSIRKLNIPNLKNYNYSDFISSFVLLYAL